MALVMLAMLAQGVRPSYAESLNGTITGVRTIDSGVTATFTDPNPGALPPIPATVQFGQTAQLINNGIVIDLDSSGSKTVPSFAQNSSTTGGVITNNGSWTKTAGDWTSFGVDVIQNGQFTIQAGNVAFNDNTYFNAGSTTTINAGRELSLNDTAGASYLNGGTLTGDGTLRIEGVANIVAPTTISVAHVIIEGAIGGTAQVIFTGPIDLGSGIGAGTDIVAQNGFGIQTQSILPIFGLGASSSLQVGGTLDFKEISGNIATYRRISVANGTVADPTAFINSGTLNLAHSRFEYSGVGAEGTGRFVNSGTMNVIVPVTTTGTVVGSVADAHFVGDDDFVNTGLIDVQSGKLTVTGMNSHFGSADNGFTGGYSRIEIAKNSEYVLSAGYATFYDGEIGASDLSGPGKFKLAENATFKGIHEITADFYTSYLGDYQFDAGAVLTISGKQFFGDGEDWVGDGTAIFKNQMDVGGITFGGNITVVNKGAARLSPLSHVNDELRLYGNSTFVNDVGGSVMADTTEEFVIQGKDASPNTSTFINNGLLHVTGTSTLTPLAQRGDLTIYLVDFQNYGDIVLDDDDTANTFLSDGLYVGGKSGSSPANISSATSYFHDGSTIYVGKNRDFYIANGLHTFEMDRISGSQGTVQVGAKYVYDHLVMDLKKDLVIEGRFIQESGYVFGPEDLTIEGVFVADGGTHAGAGTTYLHGTRVLRAADDTDFIFDAGRTLTITGNVTVDNSKLYLLYLNGASGELTAPDGRSLAGSGTFHVAAGAVLEDTNPLSSLIRTRSAGTGDTGTSARIVVDGTVISNHSTNATGTASGAQTELGARTVVNATGQLIAKAGLLDLKGTEGTGLLQVQQGGFVDLAGGASSIGTLKVNSTSTGALELISSQLTVVSDYQNDSFGTGNDFNRYAKVTRSGTGSTILAGGDAALAVGGAAVLTAANTYTVDLGRIGLGGSRSVAYTLENTGVNGASLRGAITTAVANGSGGKITDARLTGSGVTAQRYDAAGALDSGEETGNFAVIFSGLSGGALSTQSVVVKSNFENIANKTVNFTGSVATLPIAVAEVTTPLKWAGRVGDVLLDQNAIVRNAAAFGSEILDFDVSDPLTASGTNPFARHSVSSGSLNPQSTAALGFGAASTIAGYFEGSAAMDYESRDPTNGAHGWIEGSDVALFAQINKLAEVELDKVSGAGVLTQEIGSLNYTLDLGSFYNTDGPVSVEFSLSNVLDDIFVDLLGGAWSEAAAAQGFNFSGFGEISLLAGGESGNGFVLTFDPTALGIGDLEYVLHFDARSVFEGFGALAGVNLADVDLANITLTAKATIETPAPAALGLFVFGFLGLSLRGRKGRRLGS